MISLLNVQALFFIALAATGYSVATIGLKMGATSLGWVAVGLILLGFGAATLAELEILRKVDLGVVYIAIIGFETLIVLTYAWCIGEPLSLRQLGGAGMVIAGLAVVSH